jgi:hypothetical protein
MSTTTIRIPAEQVDAIDRSLRTARRQLDEALSHSGGAAHGPASAASDMRKRLEEIDDLLGQLASGDGSEAGACRLTGSRAALWDAAYDVLCSASERLADDCNDYWRALVDPADVRARIAALGPRFELLEALGPPPGQRGP